MTSPGAPFIEIPAHEARSGVYALMSVDDIVYIGQSLDLDGRIATHRMNRTHRGWQFDRVFVLLLPECDLTAHEGALIRALNPRYNNAAPANRTRDAEILERLGIPIDPNDTFTVRRRAWFSATTRATRARNARETRAAS